MLCVKIISNLFTAPTYKNTTLFPSCQSMRKMLQRFGNINKRNILYRNFLFLFCRGFPQKKFGCKMLLFGVMQIAQSFFVNIYKRLDADL